MNLEFYYEIDRILKKSSHLLERVTQEEYLLKLWNLSLRFRENSVSIGVKLEDGSRQVKIFSGSSLVYKLFKDVEIRKVIQEQAEVEKQEKDILKVLRSACV